MKPGRTQTQQIVDDGQPMSVWVFGRHISERFARQDREIPALLGPLSLEDLIDLLVGLRRELRELLMRERAHWIHSVLAWPCPKSITIMPSQVLPGRLAAVFASDGLTAMRRALL